MYIHLPKVYTMEDANGQEIISIGLPLHCTKNEALQEGILL